MFAHMWMIPCERRHGGTQVQGRSVMLYIKICRKSTVIYISIFGQFCIYKNMVPVLKKAPSLFRFIQLVCTGSLGYW